MKIRQPKNVVSNVFTLVLNTLKFYDPHREHLYLLKELSEKLSKPLIKLINVCVKINSYTKEHSYIEIIKDLKLEITGLSHCHLVCVKFSNH